MTTILRFSMVRLSAAVLTVAAMLWLTAPASADRGGRGHGGRGHGGGEFHGGNSDRGGYAARHSTPRYQPVEYGSPVRRYRPAYDPVRSYYPVRSYSVRYYHPGRAFAPRPRFSLSVAIGDFPPDGCYYYDPYCEESFASLDIYLDHIHRHHHPRVFQVIAIDGGYPVSSYCWSDGGWAPY